MSRSLTIRGTILLLVAGSAPVAGQALVGSSNPPGLPGLSAADLRRLAHPPGTPPDEPALATALVTLVDLVAKRVPENVATSSIQNLIDRRATEQRCGELRAGVEQDIVAGRTPEASVAARVRAQMGTPPV